MWVRRQIEFVGATSRFTPNPTALESGPLLSVALIATTARGSHPKLRHEPRLPKPENQRAKRECRPRSVGRVSATGGGRTAVTQP